MNIKQMLSAKVVQKRFFLICIIAMSCFISVDGTFANNELLGKENLNIQKKKYQWQLVTKSAPWTPCDGVGVLVYKNQMWLLGGWNPPKYPMHCHNEVWNSKDGALWNLVKPNTFTKKDFDAEKDWEGRHTAGYVVYKDKMWIIGGDPLQGHYQNDVWNSSDGKKWSHVNKNKPVPWGPRALHYTLVFKDKIWVMGGQTMPRFAPAKDVLYRDIWTTTDGINWEEVKPEGTYWAARGMIGGSVVFKNRMWFLGGGTYDTPKFTSRTYRNDVWSSPDGIHWKQHTKNAPWFPRQYHDVALFDSKMWVMEGYNAKGGNRKDVWYSEDGSSWHELPDTPWKARHAASLVPFNNALWMIQGNNFDKEVWKLVAVPDAK